MDNYFVYMVLCADGTYYVGVTNDADRRVVEHNLGLDEKAYTYRRRPVRLVHSSTFREIIDAIAWEKQLKGWSRAKKAALAGDDWARVREIVRCERIRRRKHRR
jgi:putative endonuclease